MKKLTNDAQSQRIQLGGLKQLAGFRDQILLQRLIYLNGRNLSLHPPLSWTLLFRVHVEGRKHLRTRFVRRRIFRDVIVFERRKFRGDLWRGAVQDGDKVFRGFPVFETFEVVHRPLVEYLSCFRGSPADANALSWGSPSISFGRKGRFLADAEPRIR